MRAAAGGQLYLYEESVVLFPAAPQLEFLPVPGTRVQCQRAAPAFPARGLDKGRLPGNRRRLRAGRLDPEHSRIADRRSGTGLDIRMEIPQLRRRHADSCIALKA